MTPRARVRCLLNRLSLSGEPAPEIPDVDTLAKCELFHCAFLVEGGYGEGGEDSSVLAILLL
jgi:hypothetical protein